MSEARRGSLVKDPRRGSVASVASVGSNAATAPASIANATATVSDKTEAARRGSKAGSKLANDFVVAFNKLQMKKAKEGRLGGELDIHRTSLMGGGGDFSGGGGAVSVSNGTMGGTAGGTVGGGRGGSEGDTGGSGRLEMANLQKMDEARAVEAVDQRGISVGQGADLGSILGSLGGGGTGFSSGLLGSSLGGGLGNICEMGEADGRSTQDSTPQAAYRQLEATPPPGNPTRRSPLITEAVARIRQNRGSVVAAPGATSSAALPNTDTEPTLQSSMVPGSATASRASLGNHVVRSASALSVAQVTEHIPDPEPQTANREPRTAKSGP